MGNKETVCGKMGRKSKCSGFQPPWIYTLRLNQNLLDIFIAFSNEQNSIFLARGNCLPKIGGGY